MVRNRGYNRLPVYHRNISNIIGIVTITTWDMMDADLLEKSLEDLVERKSLYTVIKSICQKTAHCCSPYNLRSRRHKNGQYRSWLQGRQP
jgi:hypothetical protein